MFWGFFLGSGEEGDGPVVESFEGEVEPDSYWKKKEAFLRGSTVSLGEKFSSGTCNPASPLSISCLVAFFFTEKTSFHMSLSECVIFCMQRHFPKLYIYAYWWSTFPSPLMFSPISNSAPLPPHPHPPKFHLSNGFKWPHCESNQGH